MDDTVIFGAGGHARILIDALLVGNESVPVAALVQDRESCAKDLFGVPVRGNDSMLPQLIEGGVRRFIIGVGSTGHTSLREKLFDFALRHGIAPQHVWHPTAICSPRAVCDAGVQLLAGCIVNANANLQPNVIVNSGAIVEHDCVIGSHSHIAPGARLSGGVQVGPRVHIGIGAVVKQEISIGADAVVGAGAVVVKDVPSGAVVIGVPARIIRSFAA